MNATTTLPSESNLDDRLDHITAEVGRMRDEVDDLRRRVDAIANRCTTGG